MANIKVNANFTIIDGSEIVFKAPCDCSDITGLVVYYPNINGNQVSHEFQFADAHNNDVGEIDELFVSDAVVKVILDMTNNRAYVQNADTNAYLEAKFDTKAPISHTTNKNNPHNVTAAQVGARPNTWMPTAAEVGARPNTWMPSASDVGAAIGATFLTSGADLNKIRDSGMYRLMGTHTNMPAGAAHGQLLVIHGGGDTIAQVAFKYTTAEMWVRTGSGFNATSDGTWTDWKQTYTTGFKPSAADIGALESKKVVFGFGGHTSLVSAIHSMNGESICVAYAWTPLSDFPINVGGKWCVVIKTNNHQYTEIDATWADINDQSTRRWIGKYNSDTGNGIQWTELATSPLMQIGVEYCTTERHAGKVVYRKLIQYVANGFGAASGYADLVIPHGTSYVSSCAGVEAKIVENGTVEYKLPYLSSGGGITEIIQADNGGIKIRTWNMAWPYSIIYIDLAYTKD